MFDAFPALARALDALPRLDLGDGVHHRVEDQQGGGMAGLVFAHRLEHGNIRPFGGIRRRGVFLQHAAHAIAQGAQLFGG